MQILEALKKSLDPDNLFNPGKLGLPPAEGALVLAFNNK
jgi:hypothetical protein